VPDGAEHARRPSSASAHLAAAAYLLSSWPSCATGGARGARLPALLAAPAAAAVERRPPAGAHSGARNQIARAAGHIRYLLSARGGGRRRRGGAGPRNTTPAAETAV
jgi:hypothetical protein